MKYEHFDMGSYQLHFIKTKKFKSITVDINFRREVKKEEITIRNLLKSVLLTSNEKFKTERDFIKETENLYDLRLISSNMRIGNYSNLSFKARFLNECYTEELMNEYSIAFLMDVLFHPNISDGCFQNDVLIKCKNKLEKSILKIEDNKLKYALFKLMSTTKNMPYSYNYYGDLDDLSHITSKSLYQYYQSILSNDLIDIFVVGDFDSNYMRDIIKKYFKISSYKKYKNNIMVEELMPRKRIKKVVEKCDANATQLTAFCTLNRLTDYERRYVLLVYNEMLGGSSNSILFDSVREKNSYAYYVNSSVKPYDNILLIYSGIESNNSDVVLKLIRKTLLNIGKGIFSMDSLNSAKETLVSSIMASTDTPSGIINTYYAKVLVHSDEYEERIRKIQSVSKEDIINLSRKINLHTVFVLEGDSKGEEN